MPANIEVKARLRNFEEIRRRADSLSDSPLVIIPQEDIFFNVPNGRLKLRLLGPNRGQLIYYQRADQGGPKRSDYYLSETMDPDSLRQVLESAYGIRGVVKKTRYLYLAGQTRIHLDEVEGLGQFMELEVVMREGQSNAEGEEIAKGLMTSLGVERVDLLEGAYMDLLETSTSSR